MSLLSVVGAGVLLAANTVRRRADASLSANARAPSRRVSEVSEDTCMLKTMNEPGVDLTIRQAIGGDGDASARIRRRALSTDDARVIVMAALLDNDASHLVSAGSVAVTSRDRQMVEIARAYLSGQGELVDALARDHLVDHPDSLIVAWIASNAALRASSEKA